MNKRYEYCPQLKVYDQIEIDWMPYTMFGQSKNFRSKVSNTDCFGLRFNSGENLKYGNSIFDQTSQNKNNF